MVRELFGYSDAKPHGEAEGDPVKAAQLSVRSMNFGQPWRTPGVQTVRYCITLPLAFVSHVLHRDLPEFVEDCIRFPDNDPLEAALRRREWPDIEQVLDDPELSALALKWIAHECLIKWLGDGEPKESPGYVINSVDVSKRYGEVARFEGSARRAGQSVQYQDV